MKCPRCGSENIKARLLTQTFKHYRVVGDKLCVEPTKEDEAGFVENRNQFYCADCCVWRAPMPSIAMDYLVMPRLECPRCGTTDVKDFIFIENGKRWCELDETRDGFERDFAERMEEDWGAVADGWYECNNPECFKKGPVSFRLEEGD